ncbi:MAG: putative signal transducing protein [Candidatus Humimicrobiaceae bacterium]
MNEKIKLLKTYSNRIDAELAKSFLESNGIKSMITADDAGEMYPAASVYWGVKLFVTENDFGIADDLINSIEEEQSENNI